MTSISAAPVRVPIPINLDRAEAALGGVDAQIGTRWYDLLFGAAGSSNYLARLIQRHGDWLNSIASVDPTHAFNAILDELVVSTTSDQTRAEVGLALRVAKSRAALLIGVADLGGVWPLSSVTGALTELADSCAEAASRWLLAQEIAKGKLLSLIHI